MESTENARYEAMLQNIMKEGKRIKRRNAVIKITGGITAAVVIAVTVILSNPWNDQSRQDLMARDVAGNEMEVALVAADTFFDSDLELIY